VLISGKRLQFQARKIKKRLELEKPVKSVDKTTIQKLTMAVGEH